MDDTIDREGTDRRRGLARVAELVKDAARAGHEPSRLRSHPGSSPSLRAQTPGLDASRPLRDLGIRALALLGLTQRRAGERRWLRRALAGLGGLALVAAWRRRRARP